SREPLLRVMGLSLLANSRPYEGLLFSLPTAVVLLVWICTRQRADFRIAMTRIVLPLFVIVTLTGIAMVFYNLSGTGSLFFTPYQVHEATYGEPPKFPWQALYPQPTYTHKVMANNVATELTAFGDGLFFMEENCFSELLGLLFGDSVLNSSLNHGSDPAGAGVKKPLDALRAPDVYRFDRRRNC